MSQRQRATAAILAIGILILGLSLGNRLIFIFSPAAIERHLRRETPLGSTEAEVAKWLSGRGVVARIARVHVPPSPPSDYPLTSVGGEAFIHESVAHYRFVFRTDVEVFYIFNAAGRLVDLRIRKSVDAL
jgi:hypothetical protein